jgi:hypothetical protein
LPREGWAEYLIKELVEGLYRFYQSLGDRNADRGCFWHWQGRGLKVTKTNGQLCEYSVLELCFPKGWGGFLFSHIIGIMHSDKEQFE